MREATAIENAFKGIFCIIERQQLVLEALVEEAGNEFEHRQRARPHLQMARAMIDAAIAGAKAYDAAVAEEVKS